MVAGLIFEAGSFEGSAAGVGGGELLIKYQQERFITYTHISSSLGGLVS